jgi:pimeloyl-ACP methyl ester carboxylesterase
MRVPALMTWVNVLVVFAVWMWAPTILESRPNVTEPPVAAPGSLVDLGGWRLHINCAGDPNPSQPTVVLEAGAGGFSVDWSLVQPGIARFARVCSYDRAGLGWSDLGPRPRTIRQSVWELRTLLQKAKVGPPYVFVGHSYGGILGRAYALTYPSDVAGMVLDDSGYESGVAVMRNGRMVRLVDTAEGTPVPPVKMSDPLRLEDIPASARVQIEAAALQQLPHANDPPRDRLAQEVQRIREWSVGQIKHWASNDNPFEGEELLLLLKAYRQADQPLRDKPLIVVSRGLPDGSGPDQQGIEEEHRRNQLALVGLSRTGRQIIAQKSRHEVLMYEPEIVMDAVREVLSSVRQ